MKHPFTAHWFTSSIVACLLATSSLRADWHVATTGDDGHPGTLENPFATVLRARDAVREALAANRDQHLTVWIHGGIYRLEEALQFTVEDSPSREGRVHYRAYSDDPPVFSGGRRITGWKFSPDGTWRVVVPEARSGQWRFRELFVNGERRPRARHPNDGWWRVEKAGADRRTSFTFNPGDVRSVPDLDQAELVFLHDWSTTRISVREIDEMNHVLTVTDPIGPNAPHYAIDHFEPNPRYALEGSRSYLDQAGEWHLNHDTGELSYRPIAGETPDTSEVIAPWAASLLSVTGDHESGQPVRNLHFEGLHFEHCAWNIPRRGYAGGQAAFHERRDGPGDILSAFVPAALSFEITENCVFSEGRISRLGGSGIWFGQRCRDNRLSETTVTDVSANGVMIGEDRRRPVGDQSWWQTAPGQVASDNRVERCVIERCGRQFYGSVGIWGGFTRRTVITNNEIRHLPYTGVSLGWMWSPTPTPCRENQVIKNHIHHVMQVLSDGGGIYTLGLQPGTILSENVIHDIPLNLGRAESNGMFLDEGTTDVTVADNVIYHVDKSPLRFHRATTNLVTRNLLVVKPGVDPIRYNNTRAEDIRQVNNTIAVERVDR